ncbi:hypothetical protein BH10ACI1_BH10ACI1_18880 [soil metagenome]
MSNDVTIGTLKLSETDDLLTFLKRAYDDNLRMSNVDFWKWHFLENPHTNSENLPIWIAKSGGKIAGQLAATPVVVNICGEKKKAIWILDLIIAPEFRRQGLAKKLINEAEEFCPLVLGINTKEQFSTQLLEGLGYQIILNIPRFHKFLFSGNDIREIENLKPLRTIINLALTPFRPRYKQNENVRLVEKFDTSFDRFWAESEAQWSCAVRRDAHLLEWQYLKQPVKKFDIIGYYENEKLLGYAVLYFRKKNANGTISKAAIADICYHPGKPKEIIDALLQESLRIAVERRVGGLVTDVLDNLLEERLEHFGFWRVKKPLQFLLKSKEQQDVLYNPMNWFLTRGDSDTSIFEEPNL